MLTQTPTGTFASPPLPAPPRPLVCTPGAASFTPPLSFLYSSLPHLPFTPLWKPDPCASWMDFFVTIFLLLLILLFVLAPLPSITISLFISFWPTEDFSECFHCPTDKPCRKKTVLRWRHESPRGVIWYKSVQPRFPLGSAIDFEIQTKKKEFIDPVLVTKLCFNN